MSKAGKHWSWGYSHVYSAPPQVLSWPLGLQIHQLSGASSVSINVTWLCMREWGCWESREGLTGPCLLGSFPVFNTCPRKPLTCGQTGMCGLLEGCRVENTSPVGGSPPVFRCSPTNWALQGLGVGAAESLPANRSPRLPCQNFLYLG